MNISEAKISDAIEIFDLLFIMHSEMGQGRFSDEKVVFYIRYHIEENRIFIIKEEGVIIAVLGIELVSYWYSEDQYLIDTFFYVHPHFRKTGAATLLMEAARENAKNLNLKLKIAVVNPERAKQRVVPIHGYTPDGYIMEL